MGFGSPQGGGVNPLKQYDLASDPASVVNLGQAYWKDTGSGNEFFLEDESGNVTQVTTAGTAGLRNVFPASLYVTGGSGGIGLSDPDEQLELTGRIHLGQIEAPGTTTDKLYNVAGALTWNGTDISAGGGGGGISSIVTKTGDYTADTDDDMILCNAAALTITLYAASGNSGEVLYIKNIHATGVATIDANGSETIDGALAKYITTQYESLTIVCDGSNWHII